MDFYYPGLSRAHLGTALGGWYLEIIDEQAWRNKHDTNFIKTITLFILLEVKASAVWGKNRQGRMETATMTRYYFSWPYDAVLSSRPDLELLLLLGPEGTQPEAHCGQLWETLPQWGALPLTGAPLTNRSFLAGSSRLTPKLTVLLSHEGICIYHFITPTHFRLTTWLLPLIFTGASCGENLWLTTQSMVNMQQYSTILAGLAGL